MNLETIKQTWLKRGNLAIGNVKEIEWLIERVEQLEKRTVPNKLNEFMYGLMKEACRDSFMEFLEWWELTFEEYEEIEKWFKKELDIEL